MGQRTGETKDDVTWGVPNRRPREVNEGNENDEEG